MKIQSLCVFCGSSPGLRPEYATIARTLGGQLAANGIRLVYGGGRVGLMGEIANAVLENGGEVTGVIPHGLLAREVGHNGLSDLRIVNSMHERKALMADLSDAFVALPGGVGTLEELFEVWTWAQIGIHRKPCALLNVEGYFDPLLAFIDTAVAERFLRAEHREVILVEKDPSRLIDRLSAYEAPDVPKWIDRSET